MSVNGCDTGLTFFFGGSRLLMPQHAQRDFPSMGSPADQTCQGQAYHKRNGESVRSLPSAKPYVDVTVD